MVDIISEDEQPQGRVPQEVEGRRENGTVQISDAKLVLPRKRPCYYDKQQQLELVLAA
jgi:hypothetical protein